MSEHRLTDTSLKMAVRAIDAIEHLDKVLGSDWYIKGPIRVMHADGWSPGYFIYEEDWVEFVPDYLED